MMWKRRSLFRGTTLSNYLKTISRLNKESLLIFFKLDLEVSFLNLKERHSRSILDTFYQIVNRFTRSKHIKHWQYSWKINVMQTCICSSYSVSIRFVLILGLSVGLLPDLDKFVPKIHWFWPKIACDS